LVEKEDLQWNEELYSVEAYNEGTPSIIFWPIIGLKVKHLRLDGVKDNPCEIAH